MKKINLTDEQLNVWKTRVEQALQNAELNSVEYSYATIVDITTDEYLTELETEYENNNDDLAMFVLTPEQVNSLDLSNTKYIESDKNIDDNEWYENWKENDYE